MNFDYLQGSFNQLNFDYLCLQVFEKNKPNVPMNQMKLIYIFTHKYCLFITLKQLKTGVF